MDVLDAITWQSKWYCNTEPDIAKFEGSPAERIMERLANGEQLSGEIEFSDKYADTLEVTFVPPSTWRFRSSMSSYTWTEDIRGESEDYDWKAHVKTRLKHNTEGKPEPRTTSEVTDEMVERALRTYDRAIYDRTVMYAAQEAGESSRAGLARERVKMRAALAAALAVGAENKEDVSKT